MKMLLALVILIVGMGAVRAQQPWSITQITDGSVPAEIIPETRKPVINGLPGGVITTIKNTRDIASAWYSEPTGRYRHGILGDKTEAGALKIQTTSGITRTYRLPRTEVFEDIAPRLFDLDNDGDVEVLTILTSLTRGASLAIFGLNGNALVKLAQSDFIGRSNRWLNIAGVGNFTNSFSPEIVLVSTPHTGGTLQFFKFSRRALILLISARSFSNHVIGSSELRLSAITDVDGNGSADLAVPSADRRSLVIMGFTTNGLTELARISLPSAIDKAILVEGSGVDTRFTLGLEDGNIYSVHR